MKKIFFLLLCIYAGCTVAVTVAVPLPFTRDFLRKCINDIYYWNVDASTYFEDDTDTYVEVICAPAMPGEGAQKTGEWWNIIIPDLQLQADVAKYNYTVPEMEMTVTNETFKILSVQPYRHITIATQHCQTVYFTEQKIYAGVRRRFNTPVTVHSHLYEQLSRALYTIAARETIDTRSRSHRFYLAPPSSLRNELWLYWENTDAILHISSATSWTHPDFWRHITLFTKRYDLRTDVIISSQEEPGSNAYITRVWAGRILCNCLVHGRSIDIAVTNVQEKVLKSKRRL